jgi:hypothetical protein
MPRRCQVCYHPERAAIDSGLLEGTPAARIAKRYGLTDDCMERHRSRHLRRDTAPAVEQVLEILLPQRVEQPKPTSPLSADDIFGRLRRLADRAETLVVDAEGQNSIPVRAMALRELRGAVTDLARITALYSPPQPAIAAPAGPSPDAIVSTMLAALEAAGLTQEQRLTVADRLQALADA